MYILHLGTSAKNGVGLRLPGEFIFAITIEMDYEGKVIKETDYVGMCSIYSREW